MNCQSSLIKVDAEILKKKCEKTISEIDKIRRARENQAIKKEQRKINSWSKWSFWKSSEEVSFEETKKRLDEISKDSFSYFTHYPSTYAWGDRNIAVTLLKAAGAALRGECDREILVSTDDWFVLD